MFTLSWEDFKAGKFAARCLTEKDAVDFVNAAKQAGIDCHGLDFSAWRIFEEEGCYIINIDDVLDLCHISYCNYNYIPVAVFKEER